MSKATDKSVENAPAKNEKKGFFGFVFNILKTSFLFLFRKTFSIIKFAILTAILIIALAITLVICADNVIKFAINDSAEYVDLHAKVDDVDLRFLTQTIALKNVVLKNPSGFIDHDAFTAAKIELKFDIFDKKNPIKRVYLQNPKLKIEGKFGKRILPQSLRRGNVFVIAREIYKIADIDLEKQMASSPSSPFLENVDKIEKTSELIERLGEIRIDNLFIENGLKDSIDIGSIALHGDLFELRNVIANICGVQMALGDGVFDIPTETFAVTNLTIKNPEGFPKADALKLAKVQFIFGDKKDENGNDITCIKKSQ